FCFFGGVARQTVSENLKAGITRACFHEPMVNRTYADLARHYRTAIVPARPYRPRDKAKVEVGVQIVGRWILARLHNRRFFSLAALNEAIYALLLELNDRPLRSWGRSRRRYRLHGRRRVVTPGKAIVVGQSGGGWDAIAFSSLNPSSVRRSYFWSSHG